VKIKQTECRVANFRLCGLAIVLELLVVTALEGRCQTTTGEDKAD
jgi:hypothetical protein